MAVLPLSLPLIVSAITFDLIFSELKGSPLVLLSPSRNITFYVSGRSLLADSVSIAQVDVGEKLSISVKCLSETSVHFSTAGLNSLLYSPSLCSSANGKWNSRNRSIGFRNETFILEVVVNDA
uniref:Lectin_legB domain-containing protein n=1 Tax=Angiostrongylus cantonensis TaxID=6313 RepID=A0A0K0DLQ6_ANGCA